MIRHLLALPLQRQIQDQALRMLMYHVTARAPPTTEGIHIRIVSIHQNPRLCRLQRDRQKLRRPEDAILSGPSFPRMAIQTMDKDNVNLGLWMCVDLGDFEAFDLVEVNSGALLSEVSVSLAAVTSSLVAQRKRGRTMLIWCSLWLCSTSRYSVCRRMGDLYMQETGLFQQVS